MLLLFFDFRMFVRRFYNDSNTVCELRFLSGCSFFSESPNVTCVLWNSFWLLSGLLKHHYSKACVFAKLSLCAARSFPTVGSVDDSVATELLRGFCRIAKRYVCAGKSFPVIETVSVVLFHFIKRNATWVQSARFRRWICEAILGSSSF